MGPLLGEWLCGWKMGMCTILRHRFKYQLESIDTYITRDGSVVTGARFSSSSSLSYDYEIYQYQSKLMNINEYQSISINRLLIPKHRSEYQLEVLIYNTVMARLSRCPGGAFFITILKSVAISPHHSQQLP